MHKSRTLALLLTMLLMACTSPTDSHSELEFTELEFVEMEIHYYNDGGWASAKYLKIFGDGIVQAYKLEPTTLLWDTVSTGIDATQQEKIADLFGFFASYEGSYGNRFVEDLAILQIVLIYQGIADTVMVYPLMDVAPPNRLVDIITEMEALYDGLME